MRTVFDLISHFWHRAGLSVFRELLSASHSALLSDFLKVNTMSHHLLLCLLILPHSVLAKVHSDLTADFAKDYLRKYGYIDGFSYRSANQATLDTAVRRFQDFAGLQVTGTERHICLLSC